LTVNPPWAEPVGLGGRLGRQDPRHAQRQDARLDLAAELVELLLLERVVAHIDRMPADAPVLLAPEPAQGGDPTAVAHHRQHQLVQECRVDHAVDALGPYRAHPLHEPRTALEHHVGAELFDQVAIGLRRVGQD
jgi:hypothetical protein